MKLEFNNKVRRGKVLALGHLLFGNKQLLNGSRNTHQDCVLYFKKNSRENATHRVPRDIFKVVTKGKIHNPKHFYQ